MINYNKNDDDDLNIEESMELDNLLSITASQIDINPDYVREECSTPSSSPVAKRFKREEILFCPKCAKRNKRSLLSASQLKCNEYALICKDKNCFFIETGIGIVPLGKEELIACGYPDELMFHMDVYEDDLHKITRLCIYQYLDKRTRASSRNIDRDLQEINNEIEVLRFVHGISPKDTSVSVNDFAKLCSFGQLGKDLELTVADISSDFREKVTNAFSKIKNFKFPESLIVSIKNKHFLNKSKDDCKEKNLQIPRDSCKLDTNSVADVQMMEELQGLIDNYCGDKLRFIDDDNKDIAYLEQASQDILQ